MLIIEQNDNEKIGLMAIEYVNDRIAAQEARGLRNRIRAKLPCDGSAQVNAPFSGLCYQSCDDVEDYCSNCRTVQPYYERYLKLIAKQRGSHIKLIKAIKKLNQK